MKRLYVAAPALLVGVALTHQIHMRDLTSNELPVSKGALAVLQEEACGSGANQAEVPRVRAFDMVLDREMKLFHARAEFDEATSAELGVEFEVFGQEKFVRVNRRLSPGPDGVFSVDVGDLFPREKPAQIRSRLFLEEGNFPERVGESVTALRHLSEEEFAVVVVPRGAGRYDVIPADQYQPPSTDINDSVEFRIRTGYPSQADEGVGGG